MFKYHTGFFSVTTTIKMSRPLDENWDPYTVTFDGTVARDQYGEIEPLFNRTINSWLLKPVRDEGAPTWDRFSAQCNFGVLSNRKTKVLWDQYGPITDEEAIKVATGYIINMMYSNSR